MTTEPHVAPGAPGPDGIRPGIIGLGAMGARVLALAADHPDVGVVEVRGGHRTPGNVLVS